MLLYCKGSATIRYHYSTISIYHFILSCIADAGKGSWDASFYWSKISGSEWERFWEASPICYVPLLGDTRQTIAMIEYHGAADYGGANQVFGNYLGWVQRPALHHDFIPCQVSG